MSEILNKRIKLTEKYNIDKNLNIQSFKKNNSNIF